MNYNITDAPAAIKNIKHEEVNDLDVRPILQSGGEPFKEIMSTVSRTSATGAIRLRATFEPKPLYNVLGAQGWSHWVEHGNGEDWIIWFYHDLASASATSKKSEKSNSQTTEANLAPPQNLKLVIEQYPDLPKRLKISDSLWTLDVRDLAPPEPMELTLAVLDQMPKGIRMLQLNQRVPQFLLPSLPDRGMKAEILKNEENNVEIEITRI